MASRFSHDFWSEWMQNQSGNFFENKEYFHAGEEFQTESHIPSERFLLQEDPAPGLGSPVPPGCQIYLPPKYEHKYAYPLIIWFHGEGQDEHELLSVMPEISDQNFLGLSFRGNRQSETSAHGRTWDLSPWEMDRFEEHLHDTVCELRREYHIHSERIFLAGFDTGAGVAFNLLKNRTSWFGGALLFSGRIFNQSSQVFNIQSNDQTTPVLLGVGSRDDHEVIADHAAAYPALSGAGLEVSTRMYEAGHEMTREMFKDINYWIMDHICSPAQW